MVPSPLAMQPKMLRPSSTAKTVIAHYGSSRWSNICIYFAGNNIWSYDFYFSFVEEKQVLLNNL